MTLLCVGDLNLDLAITLRHDLVIGSDTSGTIQMYGGGSAANVAAWAAEAGRATRFIGALGNDMTADFLVQELHAHGVEVRPIRRSAATSRAIAAIVGPDGDRSLVSDLTTTVAPGLGDFDDTWFGAIEWLHLTAYTYIAEHSRSLFVHLTREAAARSVPFSIDPSAAQLLRSECDRTAVLAAFSGAEILFPNHDEAEYLTDSEDPRQAAEALLDIAACVVVTCGSSGAHVARRGIDTFHVDARPVEVVNTLGCGDAFAGGFIAGHLSGHDDDKSARLAVDLATRAAQLSSAR